MTPTKEQQEQAEREIREELADKRLNMHGLSHLIISERAKNIALSEENAAHKIRLLELVREAKRAACYPDEGGMALRIPAFALTFRQDELDLQWDALNKLQEEIEKL